MPRTGRAFEEAVYSFARTLNPLSEVFFDHKARDRDTGTLRQCDVWINTMIGGHWPVKILVSCKDDQRSHRKLTLPDIETFAGEVRSTGANIGVIYSNVGFTRTALKKANAIGITCCRLYQNEPPDIPHSIRFEYFACHACFQLSLVPEINTLTGATWNDVLDIRIGAEDTSETILDLLCADFVEKERNSLEALKSQTAKRTDFFPQGWESAWELSLCGFQEKLRLQMLVRWRKYGARIEAILLNGSYCFSSGSFRGEEIGPVVDMKSGHPGDGWVEILADDLILPQNAVVITRYSPNLRVTLRESLGPRALWTSTDSLSAV